MGKFVIKVRALIDSLAASANCLSDKEKIDFVPDGLNIEFRPFLSCIHSQPTL